MCSVADKITIIKRLHESVVLIYTINKMIKIINGVNLLPFNGSTSKHPNEYQIELDTDTIRFRPHIHGWKYQYRLNYKFEFWSKSYRVWRDLSHNYNETKLHNSLDELIVILESFVNYRVLKLSYLDTK